MFQDMQRLVVIFAEVAVGDKLYTRAHRVRKQALFAGHFSDLTYAVFKPTKVFTLVYDLPADMPLYADANGFAPTPAVSANGRTVYRWDYVPADNPRLEWGAVSYWDYGRRLVVSTMPDYATLGRAYQQLAGPAAAVTPAIAAHARSIVAGIDGARAQAIAVDDWVRKNIRYVAVYIGNGGVVPHSAETVLSNRYGDCKDHATLMEALLRALGIEATSVLIAANESFRLSPVASLGMFNHAITYVPALDLYLDSTAESIQGGYLPEYELDKQTLLTASGSLGHTPLSQPGSVRNVLRVDIDADGNASFSFTRENHGWLTEPVAYSHRRWKESDRARFVEDILKQQGIKGSGQVILGDLGGKDQPYRYTLRGQADNLTYLPGTVGITAASSYHAGISQQLNGFIAEHTRSQPFVCVVMDFAEQADYHFPPGAKLLARPDDVTINNPYFRYQARYVQNGDGIQIQRHLESGKRDGRVCTPQDQQAMQADIGRMLRDLRAQFILQAAPGKASGTH
jgi:transglutaminase-like putative cysteine protease